MNQPIADFDDIARGVHASMSALAVNTGEATAERLAKLEKAIGELFVAAGVTILVGRTVLLGCFLVAGDEVKRLMKETAN